MRIILFVAKFILLPLMLLILGGFIASYSLIERAKELNGDGNWFASENGIDESLYIDIGGVSQFIRIRGRDRNNPVILDLHGGPGGAQIPWAHRSLRPLTEYFTLVEWDQRGAGLSRSKNINPTEMTYELMVSDTAALIRYLQKHLGVKKVILVGHSWGSMLGLGVAHEYPELLHAYVGVGQALTWPEVFDESRRLLTEAAKKAGDTKTLKIFEQLPQDWPPKEDIDSFIKHVQTIQGPLIDYKKSLHASKSNSFLTSNIALDSILSPDITVWQAFNIVNLSDATKTLMIDLFGRDLRTDLGNKFQIPIFIFQGAHDWQTPTSLVKPWFKTLEAPHKNYISFDDSAHIIINEEPGKFLMELVTKVRPLAVE